MNKSDSRAEREHFDDLVGRTGATWWGDRTPAAEIRIRRRVGLVAAKTPPAAGALLLEAGCGAGNLSRELAAAFPHCRLVSFDLSDGAIRAATKNDSTPNQHYFVGDCTRVAARSEQYDLVVGRSILHHVPDLTATLAELGDALKPGGKLFFSEPNPRNPHTMIVSRLGFLRRLDQWSEDEEPLSAKHLRAALAADGRFVNVRVWPYDFVHPAIPRVMAIGIDALNDLLCAIPGLRQLAGSLIITAEKTELGKRQTHEP